MSANLSSDCGQAGGPWNGLFVRLPFLLFAAAFFALNISLPYRILNSDVAIFGLMGDDILQYGYLPTYAYGQSYLFSILPYVYAAVRWLMPGLSNVMALKAAGCALNLAGLWLLFEALLLAQRRNGWGRGIAAAIFCLLLASSSSYLFDIQEHSSIEVSLFVLGWIAYFAARLDAALAARESGRGADWFLFAVGLAHALYSRPLVLAYGMVMLVGLLAAAWRRAPGRLFLKPLCWLLAGALLGYLPMLLHNLLRASSWPYAFHTHTPIGRCDKVHPGYIVYWTMFRIMFHLRAAYPLYTALIALWLAVTTGAALWVLRRVRQGWLGVVDLAMPLGSLWIFTFMILIPNFSVNETHRRYCEHLVLAAVWLFARFAPRLPRARWLTLALAAAVFTASIAGWRDRLRYERHVNATLARQLPALVAELQSYRAPILADFWDAYQLRFVSGGTLPIDAYPWDFVRTFNAIPRSEMRRRCLWLVRENFLPFLKLRIKNSERPEAWIGRPAYAVRAPLLLRQFEYWEQNSPATPAEWAGWEASDRLNLLLIDGDPRDAVRRMQTFYPRYFTTANPPRP